MISSSHFFLNLSFIILIYKYSSLPSEIFEDFIEELEEVYYKDKDTIKEILKESNYIVTPNSKVEEIENIVINHPKYANLNKKNAVIIFPKLIDKAAEEKKKLEKEKQRKLKKGINNFMDLLNSSKSVRAYSTWEQVKATISDHPAFQAIPTDEEREKMFNEYIARRKEDTSDEEGRIRDQEVTNMDTDTDGAKSEKRVKKHKKEKRESSKKDKKHHHKRRGSEDVDKDKSNKKQKEETEEEGSLK